MFVIASLCSRAYAVPVEAFPEEEVPKDTAEAEERRKVEMLGTEAAEGDFRADLQRGQPTQHAVLSCVVRDHCASQSQR